MSLKFSQGVVNALAMGQGWGDVIKGSTCVVYSGAQPTAGPEVGATSNGSTELVRFTIASGALTAEKRAWCRVVLASYGSTADVVNMKVNGQSVTGGNVTGYSSLALLKAAVIAAINSNWTYPDFYAIDSGSVVGSVTYGTNAAGEFYVLAPKNSGSNLDASTVLFANTVTTAALNGGVASTTATGNFASATNGATGGTTANGLGAETTAANGLYLTYPAVGGLVSKGGTWSGTASATGTAGWFRILCTPNFDTGLSTIASTGTDAYLIQRIDGTIGTSSADMIVTNTTITSAVSQTVSTFALTVPSA
jgi:hypothetical protein